MLAYFRINPFILSLIAWLLLYSCHSHSHSHSHGSKSSNHKISEKLQHNEATLHLWKGIKPFGQERVDAPYQQAFSEFSAYFSTMDEWRRHLYLPHAQQPKWFNFRESVQDLSVDEFLNSSFSNVQFNGRWQEDKKLMSFSFQDDPSPLQHMGDLSVRSDFAKGSLGGESIQLDLDAAMHLDTLLFSEFLHSIESVHGELDPDNLDRYGVQGVDNSQNGALKSFDFALLQLFRSSTPKLLATLESVSVYESLGEKVHLPNGQRATSLQIRQRIDLDRLEQSFEGTYDDFKDLLDSVTMRSEIVLEDGKTLLSFSYDAETKMLSFDMALSHGGFVLKGADGQFSNQLIYPSQLRELKYQVKNEMFISMFGVKVSVENLLMQAFYQAADLPSHRHASISMAMSQMPEIEVSGAFLYFLPTWLIDLLIPGTIETLIADAFEGMIQGNDGDGFLLSLLFETNVFEKSEYQSKTQHILRLRSKAELPFEVIQELLKVEAEREGDEARLYRTLRDNLRVDFEQMRSIGFAH